MLVPELQRLAQSLGIAGGGRMRKGDLVAAIQAKQGGSDGAARETGHDNSAQRGASAGADAPRHREQDAMEPAQTPTPTGPAEVSTTTTQPAAAGGAGAQAVSAGGQPGGEPGGREPAGHGWAGGAPAAG
ncbi:MAG: Rho termination factor N-terminal domain-containing protein, partial [Actinobacteria bacterium]|nr:Rho termination factor N-terminal domain-containing protein [Actinomycetota bacterium]